MLQRCIDRVRIFRIDLRTKAVAAVGDKPVGIDNAGSTARARWSTETEVVLGSAVDVVERLGVVGGDVIELRHRQVRLEVPVHAPIETLVDTAVAADEVMIGIVWIDPDVVIIDVLRSLAETAQGAASVVGHHEKDVHHVDAIYLFWIGDDASVVHRGRVKLVAAFPTAAAIARSENTTLAISRFDGGIDDIRIDG